MKTSEMPQRERPISEQYRLAAAEWADADAAATLLEETKSVALAELVLQGVSEGLPVNRSEAAAKTSKAYREHIENMVEARRQANRLKGDLKYLEMRHREWIDVNATMRREREFG